MASVVDILRASPRSESVDIELLATCIGECFACAQSCTACADACLGEEEFESLRRCIRLNLDCAEVCDSTGHILSRQLDPEPAVLRRQVELLVYVCGLCGGECGQHAEVYAHCRLCMESCRRCEQSGRLVLQALSAVVEELSASH
jgi:hypothetical protein